MPTRAALRRARAALAPLAALLLLLPALVAPPAVAAQAEESPTAVVEGINAALLDTMRNAKELGFEGRRERLEPVLTEAFSFPAMAQVAVGRQRWSDLSREERERLVDALARRSVADFAARFDGYAGERFEATGEEPWARDAVLVRNRLVKPSGEAVAINYVLRPFDEDDGGWRVIDLVLEDKFSELARTRAEYSAILQRRGFEGLIRSLEEKIAELEAEAGA